MTHCSILRGRNITFDFFRLDLLLNFSFFSIILLLVAQIILTWLLHWDVRLALNTCCVCFIKRATLVASYMNVHGTFQLVRLLVLLLLDLPTRVINLWGRHWSKEHDIEIGKLLLLLRPSRRFCQNQKSLFFIANKYCSRLSLFLRSRLASRKWLFAPSIIETLMRMNNLMISLSSTLKRLSEVSARLPTRSRWWLLHV